jgi:hypothetical protein
MTKTFYVMPGLHDEIGETEDAAGVQPEYPCYKGLLSDIIAEDTPGSRNDLLRRRKGYAD